MYTYTGQHAGHATSTRELAWGVAGEQISEQPMNAEEALASQGMLDWNVRKVALTTTGDTLADCGVNIPGKFATLRNTSDGTPVALGVVGSRYKVVQNETLTTLLDTIVDEGGAHYDAIGYFGQGEKVFAVMRLPEGIQIGGEDAHDLYIAATNAHNGTASTEVWVTAARLACTNMIAGSLRGAKHRWSMRHTDSIDGRIAEARQDLALTFKWAQAYKETGEKLLAKKFSAAQMEKFIDAMAPASDSKHEGWKERQDIKRGTILGLFREAETNEFGRGTAYAAWNAWTEYLDWYLPVKGGDDSGVVRARRQMDSTSLQADRQKGLNYLVTV